MDGKEVLTPQSQPLYSNGAPATETTSGSIANGSYDIAPEVSPTGSTVPPVFTVSSAQPAYPDLKIDSIAHPPVMVGVYPNTGGHPISHNGTYTTAIGGLAPGPAIQSEKHVVIPRRWLIILIVVLVIVVIIAIAVPVAVVVSRNSSTGISQPNTTAISPGPAPIPGPTSTYAPEPSDPISPPTVTPAFRPPLGARTMIVSYDTSSGDSGICSEQWQRAPYTYYIYPSLLRSDSTYTAYWVVTQQTAYDSSTVSDITAAATTSQGQEMWRFFDYLPTFYYGDCELDGYDYLHFAENGVATYIQGRTITTNRCLISSSTYSTTDSCSITYTGTWY